MGELVPGERLRIRYKLTMRFLNMIGIKPVSGRQGMYDLEEADRIVNEHRARIKKRFVHKGII